MQNPAVLPTPPQPPAVQTAPVTGVSTVVQTPSAPVLSYDALRAKGSELSRQLNSATSRRDGLLRDIRRASPDAKPGLQQQFDVLSGRVAQIEQDIATNGQQLVIARGLQGASGDDGQETFTGTPGGSGWPVQVRTIDGTAIGVVFTLFVMAPIALAFARNIWKRGSRAAIAPPSSREADLRMERVEQAVDTIAVEVERISEGQRFVTQLMTQMPALGVGSAQPVRVPVGEAVPVGYQQR